MRSRWIGLLLGLFSFLPAFAWAGWPHILFPSDAGITLVKGRTYTIEWEDVGLEKVPIILIKWLNDVDCVNVRVLSRSYPNPSGSGTYRWTVPQNLPDGSHYAIQVGVIGRAVAFSDYEFAISSTEPNPNPPPKVLYFALDDGLDQASGQSVELTNECSGAPDFYMASESSDFAGADWLSYASSPSFALSTGGGSKHVYFKVKNDYGESNVVSDWITADSPDTPILCNVIALAATHTESWDSKANRVMGKDTYSLTADLQLPDEFNLASIDQNTTLWIDAGNVAVAVSMDDADRKRIGTPARGGGATFSASKKDAKGKWHKTQTTTLSWDANQRLRIKVVGRPLPIAESQSYGYLMDFSGQPAGPVSTSVNVSIQFGGLTTHMPVVPCTGVLSTKPVPGQADQQLVAWRGSGSLTD